MKFVTICPLPMTSFSWVSGCFRKGVVYFDGQYLLFSDFVFFFKKYQVGGQVYLDYEIIVR